MKLDLFPCSTPCDLYTLWHSFIQLPPQHPSGATVPPGGPPQKQRSSSGVSMECVCQQSERLKQVSGRTANSRSRGSCQLLAGGSRLYTRQAPVHDCCILPSVTLSSFMHMTLLPLTVLADECMMKTAHSSSLCKSVS